MPSYGRRILKNDRRRTRKISTTVQRNTRVCCGKYKKMTNHIINSILDTDLYKFSMMQVVHRHYSELPVRYIFKCRNANVNLCDFADEIREEIDHLGDLRLTENEFAYMSTIPFLSEGYLESLQGLVLNPEKRVAITSDNGEFKMEITGNWFQTILFEVPILAIVNEVYNRNVHPNDKANRLEGIGRLHSKLGLIFENKIPGFNLIEFGTRRRYSSEWHEFMLERMVALLGPTLLGTSNVYLAMKYGLKSYGTMAHEYLQAAQALYPLHKFQAQALRKWQEVYRGSLGIALTDVVGMNAFLRDFDLLFAMSYAGLRHDSGDPFEWGEKAIAHYVKLGIDPRTKNLVFSDSLDIPKGIKLTEHFRDRIRVQTAIGTNLTNDMGFPPLNCVIKMVEADGQPVAKISDSPGKGMCDNQVFLAHLSSVYGVPYQA